MPHATKEAANAWRRAYRKLPHIREQRRVKTRVYRMKNKTRVRLWAKRQRAKNPAKENARRLRWYYQNHARATACHRRWSRANPAKVNAYARLLRATNLLFRIGQRLRTRTRDALHSQSTAKCAKAEAMLGCSIAVARRWIESQFKDGMTWDNYGLKGWHIDHKKPCSSFNLADPVQQFACFHYTNLQPLWWRDNLSKGART